MNLLRLFGFLPFPPAATAAGNGKEVASVTPQPVTGNWKQARGNLQLLTLLIFVALKLYV